MSDHIRETGERAPSTDGHRLLTIHQHLCAITDVGLVRAHNEDTFHVSHQGKLLQVADGLGGHEAGEVASALAVQAVEEFFNTARTHAIEAGTESVETVLTQALATAHQAVLETAKQQEACRGMGTTLIVAYLHGNVCHTCHVGDVRAYIRSTTGLEQITKDHSFVGSLVQAGELTPEEARVHPRKNVILQAIGLDPGIASETNVRTLREGDRLLLCSDGLWEALPDHEIQAIVDSRESIRQRTIHLVERANAAGGRDNITVILYEHTAPHDDDDTLDAATM